MTEITPSWTLAKSPSAPELSRGATVVPKARRDPEDGASHQFTPGLATPKTWINDSDFGDPNDTKRVGDPPVWHRHASDVHTLKLPTPDRMTPLSNLHSKHSLKGNMKVWYPALFLKKYPYDYMALHVSTKWYMAVDIVHLRKVNTPEIMN